MNKPLVAAAVLLSAFWAASSRASSPFVLVPDTSVEHAGDVGHRAHTNHLIAVREGGKGKPGPGPTVVSGMTPTQIRLFYDLPSTGGSNVIAIVDAYHYPTALNDFNAFARQFGLPVETSTNATTSTNQVFQVVYASGVKPKTNSGWAQEAALDIEWAHALAPGAKIVLVEAASNSFANLLKAVDVARSISGVREVSMSWGGREFSSETTYDTHFPAAAGVAFFAASGDSGGKVIYPSASPNVVSCGGTTVHTDSNGNWIGETGWSGSGGGPSAYESKPTYQDLVANTPASRRGTPDISADADPASGVAVYDSTSYAGMSGWMVFGGTSVSTPCLAAMSNLSGGVYGFALDSGTELTTIYTNSKNDTATLYDIIVGSAGSYSCASGWDFVTGVGVARGLAGL